jgi:CYTH domain-containing protein
MVRGVPEIERKFKVEALPDDLLGPGSAIRQGYLSVEPVEIRLRVQDGGHELTVKSLGGLRRVEVALPVTPEQFDELWPLATAFVEKTRHRVELDDAVAELDVYGGKLAGLLVVEVEFASEEPAGRFVAQTGSGTRSPKTAAFATQRWPRPMGHRSETKAGMRENRFPSYETERMTMATTISASDEALTELLSKIRQADSVELKLTVPLADRSRAGEALAVDPIDAQIRQVYFFDTPDLALDRAGVVVRARRVQKKGDDSVVKLRPVVPADLPSDVRESTSFGIEVDMMPGGYVCSGSMKNPLKAPAVRETVTGAKPLRKLFSKEQRGLFSAYAPEGLALEDLSILGPIFVLKLRFSPEGYDRKLVAELWLYPDNSMLLELSTKCAPGQAFQVAAETKAFLIERGIEVGGEQETKTRKALEFFSARLREESSG